MANVFTTRVSLRHTTVFTYSHAKHASRPIRAYHLSYFININRVYIPKTYKRKVCNRPNPAIPSTFWNYSVSTEMKNAQSSANIYCSQEQTRGLYGDIICLSVINTLLAITAIVGNTVILIALHMDTSLHRPFKVLIRNLVACDLCAGFVEIVFVAYWISILQGRWQTCHILFYVHVIGAVISLSMSLWTMTIISVDRLLALLLGLRYRQVVTLKRMYIVVIFFWVCPGVASPTLGILSLDSWKIWSTTNTTVCVVTSIFCYTRIFLTLRHQQMQIHNNHSEQENRTIPWNVIRYRKTVSSALWLQLTLVVCYLPYALLSQFAYRDIENTRQSAFYVPLYTTLTLMFLNSTLNPILYCWRMKELKRIVKDILSCRRM